MRQEAFSYDQLLQCGRGEMFGPGNAQLPTPNMLMLDRIVKISDEGGTFGKGEILAELDIHPDLWFFGCHFPGLPGPGRHLAIGGFLFGLDREPGPGPRPGCR